MSHYTHRTPLPVLFFLLISFTSQCARLGEASVTLSDQNVLPEQQISSNITKPGMGSNGGPATWSFWVKNRQASSDAMVGSFTPFYKLDAIRLSVSTHFVFYRDVNDAAINSTQADTVLTTLETAYANLKNVYGAGEHPFANGGARVVILAYNIQDDYTATGNYVGGYFSPRDLYSNAFTTALYTDPVAQQQYSNLIGTLGGYSNEMSIINYDLNPGYSSNATQVNDIVIHELSHLFTYSKRVLKQRLANHDLWIAEGIAESAPNQTMQTANVQALRLTQLASPSTIDYYQDAPQLTDFLTWAPKIVGYLQSNLFFNYLRHRAEANAVGSAATMLTELITLTDQTIDGVDAMIQKYIPGSNFSGTYGDFVITHYLMMLGIPIADTNGLNGAGTNLQTTYSFSNVQIGNSASTVNGTTIKSKYSAVIPYNFEAPKCADGTYGLKPNSYIIFRYKINGNQTPPDTAGANAVNGELPLKYVLNMTTEATLLAAAPATLSLRTYDAGTNIPFTSTLGFANGDIVQFIAYNPNKTGSCRQLNSSWILKRNHSKWVGLNSYGTQLSPDFDWQTDTGAAWANSQNGAYYRPSGIAARIAAYPNNFLYVVDYNNMSLQKLNLDTGAPLGRLGATTITCPTSDVGWSTSPNRYQNGYCAHNFDAPQGVHVDSAHNIYVADSNNRRIVRYDANGNFTGWIGLNGAGNDVWQTGATVTDNNTLLTAGAVTDPKMFFLPWAITTDPSDATYLYIADYGGHRILRRNRATGAYAGFIGNGKLTWDTVTTTQPSSADYAEGYFGPSASVGPRGIVISGSSMYVADEGNHRIVRITTSSGAFDGWIGNGATGWQGTYISVPGGSGPAHFKNPSAIATDGTYLYIADRLNNRISRWNMAAGSFAGWLGHGKIAWEMTASAPATDPYAGFSYYPPEYYAEPHGLAIATAAAKGTRNDYLFVTSLYNGRVTRINLSCASAPGGTGCDPIYTFP